VDPVAHVSSHVCPSPMTGVASPMQVLWAGQVLPHAIDVAHTPLLHALDRQSAFTPHALPSEHPGEHEGGGAQTAEVQMFDAQSPLAPQAAPVVQMGEQVGAAQRP
jgi:hypothetical protein